MRLGIHFVNFSLPGAPDALAPTLAATARAADEVGCSTLTMMDHWFQMEQFATAQDPMLEGYTSLGYLAGLTQRVTLGLLVTGVTYRRPGLLAKIVTTLDVLSGGRAQLGIGAAWYEREHKGLGVDFPRSGSVFSGWRRRSRSVCRCGATMTGLMPASTFNWLRPSVHPDRFNGRARQSWWGAVGSGRPCGWWRAMPTPATSSRPIRR